MKKLKFEHELAKLIIRGEKTSTWRLFDDKDLSVGDNVELIDKVEAEKPETWQPFGLATITKIVEKRLGDIDRTILKGMRHSILAIRWFRHTKGITDLTYLPKRL